MTYPTAFTTITTITSGYQRSSAGGNNYPVLTNVTTTLFKFRGDSGTINYFIIIGF